MNANALGACAEVLAAEGPEGDEGTKLLQSFCRAEMLAVEAYECALREHVASGAAQDVLEDCQLSHEQRVGALKRRLQARQASLPDSSGPWGTVMKVVEVTPAKLNQRIALDVLRGWESHTLADYELAHDELGTDDERFILRELLPRQEETHRTMVYLTQMLNSGA